MIQLSRLKSAPRRVTDLVPSAARMRARFVMLLEPGRMTLPHAGLVNGTIGRWSGR